MALAKICENNLQCTFPHVTNTIGLQAGEKMMEAPAGPTDFDILAATPSHGDVAGSDKAWVH